MVPSEIKISCCVSQAHSVQALATTPTKDTKLSGSLTIHNDLLGRSSRPTILYGSSSDAERQKYHLYHRHMIQRLWVIASSKSQTVLLYQNATLYKGNLFTFNGDPCCKSFSRQSNQQQNILNDITGCFEQVIMKEYILRNYLR